MLIQTHNARNSDPDSSHMAADAMQQSRRRQTQIEILIKFVRKNPGLTSREISQVLQEQHPALDRYAVARRLADAKGVQLEHGPSRACTACRGMKVCVTWYPKVVE